MFSSYYFYDVFSAIKTALQQETGISNAEYGSMYGAYSFTNSFFLMAFLGGIILDRWGIRKTGSVFMGFMIIGTLITAYGSTRGFIQGGFGYDFMNSFLKNYSPSLKLMILGRVIFGLGAETFYVTINKIIAKWFKGKELALAFAINVAFGRFGTAAVLSFSPRIIGNTPPIDPAVWLGWMLMIIGLIAFLVYMIYDLRFDRNQKTKDSDEKTGTFSLSDIIKLLKNKAFLYIVLLCVLFYSAVFPFLGFAPDFLHHKFGFSLKLCGDLTTILPYGTIVFTPIFGWWCDKKGKSASMMILGSLILIIVHLTFSLTSFSPYIPLFCLGIAFSLVPAAMWPSVAKIVAEKRLGTAYGFMFTIQNFGLMLLPILMGNILDFTNKGVAEGQTLNYNYAILMLAILGILGILFAFLLKKEDRKKGYGLELPNKVE